MSLRSGILGRLLGRGKASPTPESEPVRIAVASAIAQALEYHRAGRLSEAEAAYRAALDSDPDNVDALHFLGVIAFQRGENDRAADLISRALVRNAANAPALNNLGNVRLRQGRAEDAIECYRKALQIQPDYLDAYLNLGGTLVAHRRLDEAAECYRRALEIKPDFFQAAVNLANVLRDQRRLEEAVALYRRAIELKPDFPISHYNLGNALRDQGLKEAAIGEFRAAIALDPRFAEAQLVLGYTLADEERRKEAVECFRAALAIEPELAEARWALTMSQIEGVCDSQDEVAECRAAFSRELEELERWFEGSRIESGFKAVGVQQPFLLAYQEENNRALLARHGKLCVRLMEAWRDRQTFAAPRALARDGRIRVAVFCRFFRNHSVWNAIVRGWFERLDRRRFALYALHSGSERDRETAIAQECAAEFVQGDGWELKQWVDLIRELQPDVLLYPEIGMDPTTLRLASLRLAPVQAATWGHPETTGLPTVDYFLSAEALEPTGAQEHYTEQLVVLPHLGCSCRPVQIPSGAFDTEKFGIPRGVPLLVCPGVPIKYAPRYDRILVEIARRLGRCRLIFFSFRIRGISEKLQRRIGRAFLAEGLNPDEFVTFIPWQERDSFFALLRQADVMLDTIGFSGFNTAMQAVECNLPIVARESRFLRGRLAGGILRRMGLGELVAASEDEYVELGVRLAQDADYRRSIRETMQASSRLLFNDEAPIRAMEEFFARTLASR